MDTAADGVECVSALAKWSKQNWLLYLVLLAYAILGVRNAPMALDAAARGAASFAGLLATLLGVFALIGLVRVWVTDAFIMRHVGDESGWRGLAIGAALGTVMIGPLVGVFPFYESLLAKGARPGVIVAMASTWALKIAMIPLELSIFGWQFTFVRNGLLFGAAFVMASLMELVIGKDWGARFRGTAGEE
jgi:uncharacterized membrane protein YraQ (UPF0718 family)